MLPVEVRIFPTVEVIANLKMLDSYAGLTLPLMASATATFLFRQFFMTLPDELVEAARIDGASPMRFSATSCCRCQNQPGGVIRHHLYLRLEPVSVAAVDYHRRESWHCRSGYQRDDRHRRRYHAMEPVMAAMLLTLIPPVVIVLAMQRAFVRGLVDSEK